jgi:hypothetical protein
VRRESFSDPRDRSPEAGSCSIQGEGLGEALAFLRRRDAALRFLQPHPAGCGGPERSLYALLKGFHRKHVDIEGIVAHEKTRKK